MSLEAGALIVALLWGPTLLYLVFRAARGPANRGPDPFAGGGHTDASASEPGTILGYWVCRWCRSANRLADGRCYGCRAERVVADLLAPAPVPVPAPNPATADMQPAGNGWVPVMQAATRTAVFADVMGHSNPAVAGADPDGSPAGLEPAVAAPPATATRARRRARSTRVAATASEAALLADASMPASAAAAAVVVATPVADVGRQPSPSAPPVCPFLGLKGDPATRCDYPDERNQCHAGPAGDAKALPVLQRLRPGTTGYQGGGRRSGAPVVVLPHARPRAMCPLPGGGSDVRRHAGHRSRGGNRRPFGRVAAKTTATAASRAAGRSRAPHPPGW